MKILFLSHYFPPEGNAPANRVHAFARRWVEAGHEVTVITCAPNVPDGRVYQGYRNGWCSRERVDGIAVVRVKTFLAPNRGNVRRILNFLSYMASAVWRGMWEPRPDLVIATSPQFFCGWAGVILSRIKRIPFVLEIRDIWPESIRSVGALGVREEGGVLMNMLERLEHLMYRAADRVVTVGSGYRQKLLDRGVPAEKIDIVTNGVETALFRACPGSPELRAQAGAGAGDFLVGYLGTVGMAHGLQVVIDAGRLARNRGIEGLRFVVVGDGAMRESLQAALAMDDPGNVRFVGRQPKAMMPAWLASMDACLVHLKADDLFQTVLPSKIFEAIGMERPILIGVRGEAREVVELCKAGIYVEPENAADLLEKAQCLKDEATLWSERCREARVVMVKTYDCDLLAGRYLRVLEGVISSPQNRIDE